MRKRKLFDRFKLIRARARVTVGQPPTSKVVADKRNQIRARGEKRERRPSWAGAKRSEMSVQSRKLARAKRKLQDAEKKLKRAERGVLSWRRKVADLSFEQRSVAQVLLWSETPQPSSDPVTPAEIAHL